MDDEGNRNHGDTDRQQYGRVKDNTRNQSCQQQV
jgi:hypothetical protein